MSIKEIGELCDRYRLDYGKMYKEACALQSDLTLITELARRLKTAKRGIDVLPNVNRWQFSYFSLVECQQNERSAFRLVVYLKIAGNLIYKAYGNEGTMDDVRELVKFAKEFNDHYRVDLCEEFGTITGCSSADGELRKKIRKVKEEMENG